MSYLGLSRYIFTKTFDTPLHNEYPQYLNRQGLKGQSKVMDKGEKCNIKLVEF